ncbi:hypothetical protein ACHAXT_013288 [Thalassiosira profunda]
MTITNGSAGNGVDTTKSSSQIDGDGEVQFGSHHDDDVKAPASSVRRKSSFIGTMAKVARQQVHFDLQEEDDGPPVRRISELDGETFFTPRTALPKRKQALLLIEGARDDIKQHDLFSPYDSDRILNYFDGVW